jgi:hypothetical protein
VVCVTLFFFAFLCSFSRFFHFPLLFSRPVIVICSCNFFCFCFPFDFCYILDLLFPFSSSLFLPFWLLFVYLTFN